MGFETIIYERSAADRVATITLNRPDVMNAFDRRMCEEMREAWRTRAQVEANLEAHTVFTKGAVRTARAGATPR